MVETTQPAGLQCPPGAETHPRTVEGGEPIAALCLERKELERLNDELDAL